MWFLELEFWDSSAHLFNYVVVFALAAWNRFVRSVWQKQHVAVEFFFGFGLLVFEFLHLLLHFGGLRFGLFCLFLLALSEKLTDLLCYVVEFLQDVVLCKLAFLAAVVACYYFFYEFCCVEILNFQTVDDEILVVAY